MNLQKLCLEFATKEDGNEVIKILKKNNLWDNEKLLKEILEKLNNMTNNGEQ